MSAPRVLRTLRQKRLREVGEVGQARLFAAHARVAHDGLRGEFAVRYLVGAGIGSLRAPASLHASARALDPEFELHALEDGALDPESLPTPELVLEPAAREAFAGALDALGFIRRCLRGVDR